MRAICHKCPTHTCSMTRYAANTPPPPPQDFSEGVEGGKQKIWSTPTLKQTSAAPFAARAAMSKWLRMKTFQAHVQCGKPHNLRATCTVQHTHCTQTQLPAPQSRFDARSACTPRDSCAEQKHSDCHLHFTRCAQRSYHIGRGRDDPGPTHRPHMWSSAFQHTASAQAGSVTRSQRRPQPLLQPLQARF